MKFERTGKVKGNDCHSKYPLIQKWRLPFSSFSQFYWDVVDIKDCIILRDTVQWCDLDILWSGYHSKFG